MEIVSEKTRAECSFADSSETIIILEKYRLAKIIDKTVQLLNNPNNQVSDIGIISCCLLTRINNNISTIKKQGLKLKIELLLTDLTLKIYTDFLGITPLAPDEIIKEIIKSSSVTCNLFGYGFNVFKQLIDFYNFNAVINYTNKSGYFKHSPTVNRKKCKLIWNGKGRLEELIYQLQKRKLIKNKLNFFNLFLDDHAENILVKWDFERKWHLAYMLHQLYIKDLIRLVSCKGYFVYAEMHFIGFDGQVLKKDSLKRLSSSINTDPLKYANIINEVDDIIRAVTPNPTLVAALGI